MQYPDLCNPAIIEQWWAPAQDQYVSDYNSARGQNGGFFHQCYLGSYFDESFGTTPQAAGYVHRPVSGVWNQITVGGKTMQQAISDFWNDAPTGNTFYADVAWNPKGTPPNPPVGGAIGASTPVVPWYSAKWMSNPSCRGYPWH